MFVHRNCIPFDVLKLLEPFLSAQCGPSDADWKRAMECAHRQYEIHVRRNDSEGYINLNQAQRKAALDDALQHAVGLLSLARYQSPRRTSLLFRKRRHEHSETARRRDANRDESRLYD